MEETPKLKRGNSCVARERKQMSLYGKSPFIVVGIPTLFPQYDSTQIWGSLLTTPTFILKDSRMWGCWEPLGAEETADIPLWVILEVPGVEG